MGRRFAKAFMRFIAPVLIIVTMGSNAIVAGAGEINESEIINVGMAGGDLSAVAAEYTGDDSDSLGLDVCFYVRDTDGVTAIPNEPQNHPVSLYSNAIRINDAVSDCKFVYDNNLSEDLADDGITAQNAVVSSLKAYPSQSQIQEVYPSFDPETQYVFWYVKKLSISWPPHFDVFVHVDGIIVNKTAAPIIATEPAVDEPGTGDEPVVTPEPKPEDEPIVAPEPKPEDEPIVAPEPKPEDEPVVVEEPKKEDNPVVVEEPKAEDEPVVAPEPKTDEASGDIKDPNKEDKPKVEEKSEKVPSEEVVEEVEKVRPELSFEVFSVNVEEPFEYDGEEHLIGGYVIRVTDSAEGNVAEYVYGPYGDFRGVTFTSVSFLQDIKIDGTIFTHMGVSYNVNVDSAYLLVKNPGVYEIPLFFKGMIMSAADIIIRDEEGKVVDTAKLNVSTPSSEDSIRKRKITIEAGSTIQNDDGTTLTNDKVNITSGSLLPGHKLVTSIVGSQTGPGESVNEITSYDILDEDGNSCKALYDVINNKGWLVVVKQNDAASGSDISQENGNVSETTSTGSKEQEYSGITVTRDNSVLGATRDGEEDYGVVIANLIKDKNIDPVDLPEVLGARRSATDDITIPAELRLCFIILCMMAIMIINIRRSRD